MIFPMIADWFNNTMMFLFIGLIDTVCYGLLTVAYNIFYGVAQIDLFGGGSSGAVLYENITQKLYMVLSVVMVFIFAYQLIMLIIDPDGKGKGAMSQVVKDTLISIVLLICLPLVFRSMAMFQFHVLENGTIPAIIMGTNGQNSNNDPGKNVSMMVLVSFFHPNGTTYNTFFGEDGNVKSSAVEECLAQTAAADGEEHPDTCEMYVSALQEWTDGGGWITALTMNHKKLRHWVGDTMTYSIVLSSFAALACAYVFFIYAIDIGTRAVKLGVLQLISPVPVVLRIFPNTKKSFDTWFSHLKKTYLELFIRVAVIFFALEVVKMIPTFVDILWHSQDGSVAGGFTKCVATVILILGVLKFGQDAVPLFKELFSVGGNLLSGVNLKTKVNPIKGVQGRLEENKGLMWSAGKLGGIAGGVRSQFGYQYAKNTKAAVDQTGNAHRFSSAVMALGSGLRGVVTGAKSGKALTSFDLKGGRQSVITGADAANKQFNESRRLQAYSQNQADFLQNLHDLGNANPFERTKHFSKNVGALIAGNAAATTGAAGEWADNLKYEKEQFHKRIRGEYSSTQATSQALSGILDGLSGIKANTKDKTKSITKKIDDLQQIVNTSTVQSDPGANASAERKQEYQKYLDAKKLLDEAKAEKNDIIAKELSKTEVAKQFATNTLDDVLDKIKKAPQGTLGDQAAYENILNRVQDLRASAGNGSLTGTDIKDLGKIVDDLTNYKIYSNALAEQQKKSTQNLTAPASGSGTSAGGSSGGSSGSSSGSSGGSGGGK